MNIDIQSIIREILREEIRAALSGLSSDSVVEEVEGKGSTKGKVQTHAQPTKNGLAPSRRVTRTARLMNIPRGKILTMALKDFDREVSCWKAAMNRCNRKYGTFFTYSTERNVKQISIYSGL